jgi:hypothetical protein
VPSGLVGSCECRKGKGLTSELTRRRNSGHGRRFQRIQFPDDLMPRLQVPFGCKGLVQIGLIGEKIPAEGVGNGPTTRFEDQLHISLVSQSIFGASGICSPQKTEASSHFVYLRLVEVVVF